jgi:hypothetical protein
MTDVRPHPWEGETMTLPTRVDGRPIVAGIKERTTPKDGAAHQWIVIVETIPGHFQILRLSYRQDNFRHTRLAIRDDYTAAVTEMASRVHL